MFSGGVEKDRHILYLVMIKLKKEIFDPICIGNDIQLAFNIRQIYPKDFVRYYIYYIYIYIIYIIYIYIYVRQHSFDID